MTELSIALDREPQFIAKIGFAPAFEVRLEFEPVRIEQTPHGERRMRKIVGGAISGKIEGAVYPSGGGDYSLKRTDGVTDLNTHIVLRDKKGEWLYIRNIGYARLDGYQRVTSWMDVDVRSDHNWVLGLFFVGVIEEPNDASALIRFFEVL
ncbi:DUF3237 family protein [Sphingobium lignivorans]|uniref:DUF3237 domain-containing protein n=1 Tax=Sphingobium lignivorans TaxID=2735886 RepID=A0ABR6NJG2_9SPHN|nr:DUF3237 family protein [Sphingobium lignivorans]MBB5986767.1 hypothetical protein [Sphingobium lignivorans]